MHIRVDRIKTSKDSTIGVFHIDNVAQCFTLEDTFHKEKIAGETRIPKGKYHLSLRKVGGFHGRYKLKYGDDFHKGMLHVTNVPGFEHILIHVGNDKEDTEGCLLVGDSAFMASGKIGNSVYAYKSIYPIIAFELEKGNSVTIEYIDIS